jgi:hypothetical protein
MSAGDRELLVMEFVEGETFQARLERGPLPQHDVMGLGQAIASGLTAYTAIRSSSNRFSQLASWFQLAKMRLTSLRSRATSPQRELRLGKPGQGCRTVAQRAKAGR